MYIYYIYIYLYMYIYYIYIYVYTCVEWVSGQSGPKSIRNRAKGLLGFMALGLKEVTLASLRRFKVLKVQPVDARSTLNPKP